MSPDTFLEIATLVLYGLAGVWGLGGLYRPQTFRRGPGDGLLAAGFVFLTAMVLRGGDRVAAGGLLAQSLLLFVWFATVIYALIQIRFRLRPFLGFVAPMAFLVLAGATGSRLGHSGVIPEEVRTGLVKSHVLTIFAAYAGFATAFLASLMFLIQHRRLRLRRLDGPAGPLPPLESLEHVGFLSIALAFPVLSVSLALGVVGQAVQPLLGDTWFRDPKVVGGVLVWLVYGLVLNAHLAGVLRGYRFARTMAWAFAWLVFVFGATTFVCGVGAHSQFLGGVSAP